jgi:hypothetical protein
VKSEGCDEPPAELSTLSVTFNVLVGVGGAGSTVREYSTVEDTVGSEMLVAVILNVDVPLAVGVPEIVEETLSDENERPTGNEPVSFHANVSVALLSFAVKFSLYGTLTWPSKRGGSGLIVSVGVLVGSVLDANENTIAHDAPSDVIVWLGQSLRSTVYPGTVVVASTE